MTAPDRQTIPPELDLARRKRAVRRQLARGYREPFPRRARLGVFCWALMAWITDRGGGFLGGWPSSGPAPRRAAPARRARRRARSTA